MKKSYHINLLKILISFPSTMFIDQFIVDNQNIINNCNAWFYLFIFYHIESYSSQEEIRKRAMKYPSKIKFDKLKLKCTNIIIQSGDDYIFLYFSLLYEVYFMISLKFIFMNLF